VVPSIYMLVARTHAPVPVDESELEGTMAEAEVA
jgi:hypothetical protein